MTKINFCLRTRGRSVRLGVLSTQGCPLATEKKERGLSGCVGEKPEMEENLQWTSFQQRPIRVVQVNKVVVVRGGG